MGSTGASATFRCFSTGTSSCNLPPTAPSLSTALKSLIRMSGQVVGSRTLPIGFYLGQHGLSVAQVVHDRRGWRWSALFGRDYPCPRAELLASPKRFRKFAAGTLKDAHCCGRAIVSALPIDELRILSASYSVTSGQDETQCLLRHLKERLREDLSRSVIDWMPIREGRDKAVGTKSALVAVARRDQVTDYLDLLVSAGLEPLALDIGPAALARLVRISMPSDKLSHVLLINFGREITFLSMLQGRRLMLDRGVSFGEASLVQTIARAFDLPDEDAAAMLQRYGVEGDDEMGAAIGDILKPAFSGLVREISRVLVYFASQTHGGAVNEIRILGTLSECPGVADLLARTLEAPVSLLDPATLLASTRPLSPPPSHFGQTGLAVAAGLSLRGQA